MLRIQRCRANSCRLTWLWRLEALQAERWKLVQRWYSTCHRWSSCDCYNTCWVGSVSPTTELLILRGYRRTSWTGILTPADEMTTRYELNSVICQHQTGLLNYRIPLTHSGFVHTLKHCFPWLSGIVQDSKKSRFQSIPRIHSIHKHGCMKSKSAHTKSVFDVTKLQ